MQTKLLVLDVDGTLTDGGLYLDSTGIHRKVHQSWQIYNCST